MKLSVVFAFALVLGTAVGASTLPAVAAMTATQSSEVAQMQATAKTAQAAIVASPDDMKAMQSAIAAQSSKQAAAVLLRHGFTADQLNHGLIVFKAAMLPSRVRSGQFFYIEIDHSPFKISVHGLP